MLFFQSLVISAVKSKKVAISTAELSEKNCEKFSLKNDICKTSAEFNFLDNKLYNLGIYYLVYTKLFVQYFRKIEH